MAQKTAWNAAALTEADINLYLMGEGGAWQSWTPTVTQGVNVTVTNTRSRFARYGRTIHVTCDLAVTGTGTTATAIIVSLPTNAAASTPAVGSGLVFDTSASVNYSGFSLLASTTTVGFLPDGVIDYIGATPSFALASGDSIRFGITYEAAA